MNKEEFFKLRELPKEFRGYKIDEKTEYRKDVIDKLFVFNKHLFDIVSDTCVISDDLKDKLIKMINSGELIISEKNIKLFNSFSREQICEILDKHFEYAYLIDKDIFFNDSLALVFYSNKVGELLNKHRVKLRNNPPEFAFKCVSFVLEQLKKKQVDINTLLPYLKEYDEFSLDLFIDGYIKEKGIDFDVKYKELNMILMKKFKGLKLEYFDSTPCITECNDVSSLSELIYLQKIKNLEKVDVNITTAADSNSMLNMLRIAEKLDIDIECKDGFVMVADSVDCLEFIELTNGLGSVELDKFEPNEFMALYEKASEYEGLNLYVPLDTFMEYEDFFLSLAPLDNVKITSTSGVTTYTLTQIFEISEEIDEMIEDIDNEKLSPFEKYIFAYNAVKSFKEYKLFYGDDKLDDIFEDQSRNPYLIMKNDSIVCAGYCFLLKKLLNKLGINSTIWNLDGPLKQGELKEDERERDYGHSRLYVNIVDPKYNIDGYYMCDPTWDYTQKDFSFLEGYNYLCMTTNESHNYDEDSPDYETFGRDCELFNDQLFRNPVDYFFFNLNRVEGLAIIKELDPQNFLELKKISGGKNFINGIVSTINKKINNEISNEVKGMAIVNCAKYLYDNDKMDLEELLYIYDSIAYLFKITIPYDEKLIKEFKTTQNNTNIEDDDWYYEEKEDSEEAVHVMKR